MVKVLRGYMTLAWASLQVALTRTSREALASQYLIKNTGVVDGSLHLYLSQLSFYIYVLKLCVYISSLAC